MTWLAANWFPLVVAVAFGLLGSGIIWGVCWVIAAVLRLPGEK